MPLADASGRCLRRRGTLVAARGNEDEEEAVVVKAAAPMIISPPKAITFDCYGTLIDWEGEIASFFSRVLAAEGGVQDVDIRELQRHWEDVQFTSIAHYRPYREILHDTMGQAFSDFGLPYREAD